MTPYIDWLKTVPAGELDGSLPKDTLRAFNAGGAAERARIRRELLLEFATAKWMSAETFREAVIRICPEEG